MRQLKQVPTIYVLSKNMMSQFFKENSHVYRSKNLSILRCFNAMP